MTRLVNIVKLPANPTARTMTICGDITPDRKTSLSISSNVSVIYPVSRSMSLHCPCSHIKGPMRIACMARRGHSTIVSGNRTILINNLTGEKTSSKNSTQTKYDMIVIKDNGGNRYIEEVITGAKARERKSQNIVMGIMFTRTTSNGA